MIISFTLARRSVSRALLALVVSCTTMALASSIGCASSSHGTKIDQTQLNSIQKGVTTRAQVEAMFGPPMSFTINPDGTGRRTGMWMYSETQARAKGQSFIPIYGMFAGGATAKTQTQTLSVIFTKDEIVEDYAFSGGAQTTDMKNGPFNSKVETKATTPTPAAN